MPPVSGLLLELLDRCRIATGSYDVFPPASPPYYRVRYDASTEPGRLIFPVNYTIWIPPNVEAIRGVIVHQHGCGEGSCKSGLTGAYDLHWQALAKRHQCALLAPAYEQPEGADCQMWCDPRNGSDETFQRSLADLGAESGHPELSSVPWALWGHSGGGHWAGGMTLLHPERVIAAWLRSGVPLLEQDAKRPGINPHRFNPDALKVPMMCNLGTQEGVTVKDGRFASVWPANQSFFEQVRSQGGLIGIAIDPLTAHECGNQRYLAIRWLDACLAARLPEQGQGTLRAMPADDAWLADLNTTTASSAKSYPSDALKAIWLPNESIAKAWMQYVVDTHVIDETPPPAPTDVHLSEGVLTWQADADEESGLAGFLIECDGKEIARVPQKGANPFGRPLFQNLQYSDTPSQPLVEMNFKLDAAHHPLSAQYRISAINTEGLRSAPAVASQ